MFKKSFNIAITVCAFSAFAILFTGHWQAQYLVQSQPMKMAAAEALWENSGDPAPFTVYANINTEERQNDFSIDIPVLLSFLSFNEFSGSLEGMNDLQAQYEEKYGPGDYIPPVKTLFWVFRIMTGAGGVMLLLGFYGIYMSRKETLVNRNVYLKIMTYAIALPFIANTSGWIITEMGRQPWVVFGLMKTEDAISPSVTANEVLFSLISFTTLYTILAIITIYLFVRHIKKKNHDEIETNVIQDPFDKEEGGAEVVS